MSKIIFLFILIVSTANAQRGGLTSPRAGSQGGGLSAVQKQDAKEKARWTFNDWLDTKKVMANQNMWLAGNRTKPVAHEFYISYDQATFEKTTEVSGTTTLTRPSVSKISLGAFTSFVGLSASYLDLNDNVYGWDLQFNLRVFGNSIQNTNFTFIYGGRTRIDNSSTTSEAFRNPYYGASFAIYLSKQFGLEGLYRQYEPSGSDLSTHVIGNNIEGTIFIDYAILRVQGTWFKESLEKTPQGSSTVTTVSSTGILAGAKFYF